MKINTYNSTALPDSFKAEYPQAKSGEVAVVKHWGEILGVYSNSGNEPFGDLMSWVNDMLNKAYNRGLEEGAHK